LGGKVYIESKHQLRQLYALPKARAIEKELDLLDEQSIRFIQSSPFVVISTFDEEGKMNISPRGGAAGFVSILSHKSIIIPDVKGNNRIDSLFNIVETGKVGCLFLVPNLNETLRINGNAKVSINKEHLGLDFGLSRPPKSCIEVAITEVFLHCSMSLIRSKLRLG